MTRVEVKANVKMAYQFSVRLVHGQFIFLQLRQPLSIGEVLLVRLGAEAHGLTAS